MLSYDILVKVLYFFEILSLLLVISTLVKGKRDANTIALFVILLLTFTVETIGFVQSLVVEDPRTFNNQLYFNLYNYLCFSLWYYIYYQLLVKYKFVVITFFVGYFISVIVEYNYLLDHTSQAQVLPFVFGGLSLCICVLLYFVEILKSDDPRDLLRDLFFWVGAGIMFYYTVNIPFKLVQNYSYETLETYNVYLYHSSIFFSCLMYIFFCIGLYKSIQVVNSK